MPPRDPTWLTRSGGRAAHSARVRHDARPTPRPHSRRDPRPPRRVARGVRGEPAAGGGVEGARQWPGSGTVATAGDVAPRLAVAGAVVRARTARGEPAPY